MHGGYECIDCDLRHLRDGDCVCGGPFPRGPFLRNAWLIRVLPAGQHTHLRNRLLLRSGAGLEISTETATGVQVWPSCPSDGWSRGVHKLTSLPNGEPLWTPDTSTQRCTTVPGRSCIEVHRPKWKGTGNGFPAVNSAGSLNTSTGPAVGPHLWAGMFPSMIPLNLTRVAVGPEFHSMFSSESPGATVFSSFESMAPTLAPEHWSVHGGGPPDVCGHKSCFEGSNVMAQRN